MARSGSVAAARYHQEQLRRYGT